MRKEGKRKKMRRGTFKGERGQQFEKGRGKISRLYQRVSQSQNKIPIRAVSEDIASLHNESTLNASWSMVQKKDQNYGITKGNNKGVMLRCTARWKPKYKGRVVFGAVRTGGRRKVHSTSKSSEIANLSRRKKKEKKYNNKREPHGLLWRRNGRGRDRVAGAKGGTQTVGTSLSGLVQKLVSQGASYTSHLVTRKEATESNENTHRL